MRGIKGGSRLEMGVGFGGRKRRKGNWSGRLEKIGFVASHLAFLLLLS